MLNVLTERRKVRAGVKIIGFGESEAKQSLLDLAEWSVVRES